MGSMCLQSQWLWDFKRGNSGEAIAILPPGEGPCSLCRVAAGQPQSLNVFLALGCSPTCPEVLLPLSRSNRQVILR